MYVEHTKRQVKYTMRNLIVMFVTAVCFLCLLKLKWPKNKNIYDLSFCFQVFPCLFSIPKWTVTSAGVNRLMLTSRSLPTFKHHDSRKIVDCSSLVNFLDSCKSEMISLEW